VGRGEGKGLIPATMQCELCSATQALSELLLRPYACELFFTAAEDYTSRMSKEACLAAKRRNENLRRRIETLFNKAYKIWRDYSVNVAMILKKNSQYYTYRFTDRPT
jgi:hypothetical protein